MEKLAYFFIDDTIWVMRDIARSGCASLFDNPFMKMLKKAHDEYGMTVQLNLFYRTDFFYGSDEFTLSEMPDKYKPEFEAASDWLRLQFHAKQEFPDYPYVNASYEDVKKDCEQVLGEIRRFAGEKSLCTTVCPHWLPISREGCRALADLGIKFVNPSTGERTEFTGDDSVLPYGHAARLRQNRKPETMLFTRRGSNKAIASSICGYNHISEQQRLSLLGKNASIPDPETGISFRLGSSGICLNLETVERIVELTSSCIGDELIGVATHEQYFYPDYYAYQPDYAEKIYAFCKVLHDNGYRFITSDEMK